MATQPKDIFICHTGADKAAVVRPIFQALKQSGISCWYDEAEIKWGESVTKQVNEGLRRSRYVIVVLSPAFIQKPWPQRELDSVLNEEASSGQVRVLPLLIGNEKERESIIAQYPLLNDKLYITWDGNPQKIVDELHSLLGTTPQSVSQPVVSPPVKNVASGAPMPKIPKQFSQPERNVFLRNTFAFVKQYFKDALGELNHRYQQVETDFNEVDNTKFTCTVCVNGNTNITCKIWIGGLLSSDGIAYSTGHFSISNDNSLNELLTVADNAHELGFKPMMGFFGRGSSDSLLTTEKAAEHLWLMFTERLKQGG